MAISVHKTTNWLPWFGHRSEFIRLAQLCEEVFESQRLAYISAAEEMEFDATSIEADFVTLTADEGNRSMTGPVTAVSPSLDFPHTKLIIISGKLPHYPSFGTKAELAIRCRPRLGVEISVSSNDEEWASQAYARLTEEAARRRPWWANMRNERFRTVLAVITIVFAFLLFQLVDIAFNPKHYSPTWWAVVVAGNLSLPLAGWSALQIPLFEVHPEGGTPRAQAVLKWTLFATPFAVLISTVVNLLTD